MIAQRTTGLHSLLILLQIACAAVLYLALFLWFFHARGSLDLTRYILYGGIVVVALTLEALSRDKTLIRTSVFERSLVKLHRPALRQTFAVLVALVLLVTLMKDATLSRVFLATFLVALYLLLLGTNSLLPPWIAQRIFRGIRTQKTLLVGPKSKMQGLQPWLQRKMEFGFQPVGILCEKDDCAGEGELPVLGEPGEICEVIRAHGVSQVIVLGLPLVLDAYSNLTRACNACGARLMILSDLDDRLQHPTIHIEDDGLQFITLRQEPLENPLNRIMKRLLDIAVALPITVSILPIVGAVVWLCHRLQSPGPLFYRQARAGIQNRQFDIVKFRTMHVGNHDITRQATNGDPRIFPAGRWLRKLSLDELPQFWNVLRGEMSVVGPRPHLIEHNDQFARVLANYHIRAFVRPGITGLAQVRGFRGEATTTDAIAARLEADTLYLENWSLFLDLGLILRTAWQMLLPPKSAY